MEAAVQTQAVTEVAAAGGHEQQGAQPGLMHVDGFMVGLTWTTFLLLALVLYKVAWKPILKVLDQREKSIRDALDQAEKARVEAGAAEIRNRQLIQAAEQESRKLVADAKLSAQETAALVRSQAEQNARLLLQEARRDIEAATEQARIALRQETTDLAISLAGKVIAANMDSERNRTLVNDLEKELKRA